jgi:hypothetical protein
MSNPYSIYKANYIDNLPSGVTYDSTIARFFYNGKSFFTPRAVDFYRLYLAKFGFSHVVRFGELTAIGAGTQSIEAPDGDYGEFTVSSGQITPNSTPLTVGSVDVGGVTVTVEPSVSSVSTSTELAAALIAAAGDSISRSIQMRAGDYDISVPNWNRDMTGKGLTITHADERHSARFVDTGSTWNGAKSITIDGIAFHRGSDYIQNTGNDNFITGNASTSDILLNNCAFTGDDVALSVLQDDVTRYPTDGYPVPKTVNFGLCGAAMRVENCTFNNVWNPPTMPQTNGSWMRDCTVDTTYFDGARWSANDNSADGDEFGMERVTINNMFGYYNEIDGSSSPHNDQTQLFNNGGATITGGGVMTVSECVYNVGDTRSNATQGVFVQSTHLEALLVKSSLVTAQAVHGVSVGQSENPLQVIVADSSIVSYDETGSAQFRHTDCEGAHLAAYSSIFTGEFNENTAATDSATEESVNSVFSASDSDFAGPLNPTTASAALASWTPKGGSAIAGIGAVSGGALVAPKGIPRAAAAPALTAGDGQLNVVRAVPANLDGASVDRYQLSHRAGTGAWTVVDDIGASYDLAAANGTARQVKTRPITADGLPGLWSPPATETPTSGRLNEGAPTPTSGTSVTDNGDGTFTLLKTGSVGTLRAYWAIDTATNGTSLSISGTVKETSGLISGRTVIVRDAATSTGSGDNLASEISTGVDGNSVVSLTDLSFTANHATTSYIQVVVTSCQVGQGVLVELAVQ